jgi:hypothetical protein
MVTVKITSENDDSLLEYDGNICAGQKKLKQKEHTLKIICALLLFVPICVRF